MSSPTSLILSDGSVYSGEVIFHHHQQIPIPHGTGIRQYLNGKLYIGEWNGNQTQNSNNNNNNHDSSSSAAATSSATSLMHGRGLLLHENGDIFEGHFENGNYHGRGFIFSRQDERAKRGSWNHGKLLQIEDVIGNADDANYVVKYHSGKGASFSSHNVPHFKQMELEAVGNTMKDLRIRLEQTSNNNNTNPSQNSNHNNTLSANQHNNATATFGTFEKSASTFLHPQSTGIYSSDSSQQQNHIRSTSSSKNGSYNQLQNAIVVTNNNHQNATSSTTTMTMPNQNQNQQLVISSQQHNNANDQTNTNNNNMMIMEGISPEPFGNVPANAPVIDQILSNQLLLTVSGPSYNFSFSVSRFLRFFSIFVFPFLSLPGIPICPLRVDGIDLEREYVVSGAALRADFELPSWEIYFGAISIIFLVAGSAVSTASFSDGTIGYETSLSFSDVAVPAVLIFIFALLQSAYQSFHRTAHALERLDRHHFPRLAALSGQCIDANCHTLVVSWDEEGLGRVMNKKYKYKWASIGVVYGFILGFSCPLVRLLRGQHLFAGDLNSEAEVSSILCFLSTWIIASGITYEFWRILDLERQLDETMTVISRCAYLKGQSILRPSDNRKFKFHFDAPVSMQETNSGFLGWYITRSFALYASTLSNHRSRHAFISMLALAGLAVDIAIIIDTFRSLQRAEIVFTTAHGFAFFVIFGWSLMLLRFLYVANAINQEVRKHLYLADVAGMFHMFKDSQAANIISRCRSMIDEHDYSTKVLGIRISDNSLAVAALLHGLAIACMIVGCVMWGFQLTGKQSDLLKF